MALQIAGKLQGRADLFRKIVFTKNKIQQNQVTGLPPSRE
jgi:hypothetical protein